MGEGKVAFGTACWLTIICGTSLFDFWNRQTCRSKAWKTLVPLYLSAFSQITAPANVENGYFSTLAGRPHANISEGSRMAESNCAAVEPYTSERSTKSCRKHL